MTGRAGMCGRSTSLDEIHMTACAAQDRGSNGVVERGVHPVPNACVMSQILRGGSPGGDGRLGQLTVLLRADPPHQQGDPSDGDRYARCTEQRIA